MNDKNTTAEETRISKIEIFTGKKAIQLAIAQILQEGDPKYEQFVADFFTTNSNYKTRTDQETERIRIAGELFLTEGWDHFFTQFKLGKI